MSARQERAQLERAFPDAYRDGARRGLFGDDRYPPGFLEWPLDQRNAWFAGFNIGLLDRLAYGRAP
jgi:hypothetical protein